MASIYPELQAIREAVYGEEVRGSIIGALEAMNTQAAAAQMWATGEDDPTDEPGPENNAKYYADVLNGMKGDLENLLADYYYDPIKITSLSASPATIEVAGSGDTDVGISFSLNKEPTTLTIASSGTSETLTPEDSGTYVADDVPITAIGTKTWTLTATDDGAGTIPAQSVSGSVTLSVLNRFYYGVAAAGTVDNTFIKGLSDKPLSNSRARIFTKNVGTNMYVWYIYPARLGLCKFEIDDGFEGGFDKLADVEFQNDSYYTETYHVYRSTNHSLGNNVKVAVKEA